MSPSLWDRLTPTFKSTPAPVPKQWIPHAGICKLGRLPGGQYGSPHASTLVFEVFCPGETIIVVEMLGVELERTIAAAPVDTWGGRFYFNRINDNSLRGEEMFTFQTRDNGTTFFDYKYITPNIVLNHKEGIRGFTLDNSTLGNAWIRLFFKGTTYKKGVV